MLITAIYARMRGKFHDILSSLLLTWDAPFKMQDEKVSGSGKVISAPYSNPTP